MKHVKDSTFHPRTWSRKLSEAISRIVLYPCKSRFSLWCNVPDVCVPAPPDAMIWAPSDSKFPVEYFDILSSCVQMKSLGRIELGPNSKFPGSLEPPPLSAFAANSSSPQNLGPSLPPKCLWERHKVNAGGKTFLKHCLLSLAVLLRSSNGHQHSHVSRLGTAQKAGCHPP